MAANALSDTLSSASPSPLHHRLARKDSSAPDGSLGCEESFQDVGVHRVSRMVLQSLHFPDAALLSSNAEDAAACFTYGSNASSAHERLRADADGDDVGRVYYC